MPLAKKLTWAEKLDTFDLYLELRSLSLLAEKLGINTSTAATRLRSVGIWEHPNSKTGPTIEEANGGHERIQRLREKLLAKLEADPGTSTSPKPFGVMNPPVHPAALLETVQLYRELQNASRVAEKLGVSTVTVINRINGLGLKMRPRGSSSISFEQANKPGAVEAAIGDLNKQVAALRVSR